MVNMYFNGKSFVYCRKQEQKVLKLIYRGSIYLKWDLYLFFKKFKIYFRFKLSIDLWVIRKTYCEDIFYLFKNLYIRIFRNEKWIKK